MILAGGLARRMGGGDKALRPLAGRPLLAHVADRLAPQVRALALSANSDPARFAAFGLPVLADPVAGALGPLAGLAAGWIWAAGLAPPAALVATVAVDTPFLPEDLVARLAQALAAAPEAEVAVAASAGRVHPVAALHRIGDVAALVAGLSDGSLRRVMSWIDGRRPVIVDFPALPCDPFENLNTEADLARAEARIRAAADGGLPLGQGNGSPSEARTSGTCQSPGDGL
ncbi:molybdenum cofactor guanylyltransferase [Siculibacillus lacustris]|uniref:Molybdenum cofactor guanylyltransferase n=1 Tax=Siculibacillus lacustris TaxID=1549641 RepID=A0A4Q9VZD5_9HYPH|nr:molybdenum cofactor guanylyltransferase [Siculibacillus lacustris]